MVNGEDPKQLILSFLRQAQAPVGGETLAQAVGISRVAVWKQIRSLRDLGYGIESAHQGYFLRQDADTPAAWEIHPAGKWTVFFTLSSDSTMEACRRLKEEDLPAALIAGAQSEGKNRDGKPWVSPEGGLYATLRLIPEGCVTDAPLLGACASLAAAATIGQTLHREAEVRWPNEILIDGKKAGGVLVEASGFLGRANYLAVGIGLWPERFHRALMAQTLLDNFDFFWSRRYESFTQWKDACAETARRQAFSVGLKVNGTPVTYRHADIDQTGRLVLHDRQTTVVCGFSDKIEYPEAAASDKTFPAKDGLG